MFYVKFDAENKSVEMRLDPPLMGEESSFVLVQDDALFGKRLIALASGVREFTEAEYADEAQQLDRAHKAIVIDNMVRSLLNETQHLALPDYFDGLPAAKKKAIKGYRDALRAVKSQPGYPDDVTFPEPLT